MNLFLIYDHLVSTIITNIITEITLNENSETGDGSAFHFLWGNGQPLPVPELFFKIKRNFYTNGEYLKKTWGMGCTMPRGARVKSSTGIYHIVERGNERANIFRDTEDKMKFINILRNKKKEMSFEVYAYCLMDNHVHLLIKESQDEICNIMKSINVSYVIYFNKKYDRIGHLFQGRFKSEAVENDSYLINVLRYIHQNPFKADMVEDLDDYPWSSYIEYTRLNEHEAAICDIEAILPYFSEHKKRAVELFRNYMKETCEGNYLDIIDNKNEKASKIHSKREGQNYLNKICYDNGISREELISQKAKIGSLLHEVIKYLKMHSNLSYSDIAEIIGISKTTVSRVK